MNTTQFAILLSLDAFGIILSAACLIASMWQLSGAILNRSTYWFVMFSATTWISLCLLIVNTLDAQRHLSIYPLN